MKIAVVARTPSGSDDTRPFDVVEAFVEKLGRALHRFGSPAHRLEEALILVSRRLGIEGQFFSTPTAIFASLGGLGHRRTMLVRIEPGEVDLDKLGQLDRVLGEIVRGEVDVEAATAQVDGICAAPSRYGPVARAVSFALASGAAARFFGGGAGEIVGATAVGAVIGLFALLMAKVPNGDRLFELLAAVLSALLAAVLATSGLLPIAAPFVVTLSGLIVLVPGLTLTVAMNELATRNLTSGSSRLSGALLVFLVLAFGVAVGTRLGELLAGPAVDGLPAPLPAWSEPVALVFAAAAFTVLLKAAPRDFGWILGAGLLALVGGRLGTLLLPSELAPMVGALLVGLGGNAYSRLLDRPAVAVQVPGLILLVPGSIGLRSLSSLLEHDPLAGVQTAFTMTLVAVALVTGLLVANVVVPPRRPL